ncbi:MAG: arginine--tRNA ligase [Pseudomonadota bacterium]|nr:arginine--tRNA ligase [Pseudomonadota bacterium]
MRLLHNPVKIHIAEIIHPLLPENSATIKQVYENLVEPPNPEMGHLAFGCFQLAKLLRQGPPQISKTLQEKVKPDEIIDSAVAAGPYLNFKLKTAGVGQKIITPILSGSYFKTALTENAPKTMVEYSQPNTHKELHVGHMRNLCLGNSLVRVLKYSGYNIIASTFPGDMGTHVAKCLWYMKYHNKESVPTTNRGEWLGKHYSRGHIALEDEENTPNGPKNKEQLTLILKQLEAKKGEYYELWKETREWSIDLMKSVYAWADVTFDSWYWESEVDADSVKLVKKFLAEGKLQKSEGAVGLDLTKENLGFCLLLKSDGTGLYATKDLELARRKFEDFKIQKSIYVVDMRQALHFKQVFRVLELLGFPQAKDCFHLQYNFVELPDGAMSSRKGNIVPLISLIHEMERVVNDQYLSRYKDEWTEPEINKVATQVAKGAIFYGMLRMDNNKQIIFDMKEWLKIDGDSGPFIQYSYARIESLCRKLNFDAKIKPDWSLLAEKSEVNLCVYLMHFNATVLSAAENHKPALVCNYLYDLAKKFNQFYHDCPIGTAANDELKTTRLALAYAAGRVLKNGLDLLGIPTPEKM